MTFNIGDVFECADGIFPEGAAEWCNENRAYIEEIEPSDEGVRRFQIVAIPYPTEEEKNKLLQTQLTAAVQDVLDKEAQKLGYDSCLSACSYVDTGVTKFDDEGKAFRAWRSAVWATGYEILDEVVSGKREIPTEEELIAELPPLEIVYSKD